MNTLGSPIGTDGHVTPEQRAEYMARAQRLRAQAMRGAFADLVRLMARLVTWPVGRLAAKLAGWRQRERDFEALSAMDDATLSDLGMSRGEIYDVVYGHKAPRWAASNDEGTASAGRSAA